MKRTLMSNLENGNRRLQAKVNVISQHIMLNTIAAAVIAGVAVVVIATVPSMALAQSPATPPAIDPTVMASDAPAYAKRFDADLHKLGVAGSLSHCRQLVRGDRQSFGGICRLSTAPKPIDLLMCDDDLLGHFALSTTFVATTQAVSDFTRRNCVGG